MIQLASLIETDLRTIRILRYAIGITLVFSLAMGIGWPLSFIAPIFLAGMLAPPAKPLTIKAGVFTVLSMVVGCVAGLVIVSTVLNYPFVCLLVISLSLFLTFYANHCGLPSITVMMLLIGVILLPFMGIQSSSLSRGISSGLIWSGFVAVVIAWLMYGLLPDPVLSPLEREGPTKASTMSEGDKIRTALTSTLIVLPLLVIFFALGLVSELLVLIFVAILAQQPSLTAGKKISAALIVGNVMGGLVAIIVYNLLVVSPGFVFLIAMILFTTLAAGQKIFSEARMAPLVAMAVSTLLLIIGSTTGSYGPEADAKFYTRIAQIICAAIYIIGAFKLVEIFTQSSEQEKVEIR